MRKQRPNYALIIILAIGLILYAVQAFAQQCYPSKGLAADMLREYQETPKEWGVTRNGDMLLLFVSKDETTWTMILFKPDGFVCPVSSGTDWVFKAKGDPA